MKEEKEGRGILRNLEIRNKRGKKLRKEENKRK
jgi:hypothetical protein